MTDHTHDIEKYLRGELTPAEMHALEKKALDDPFLAGALEGAEQIGVSEFSKDIAALNEKIYKQNSGNRVWIMRLAAGFAILAISSFIIWFALQPEPVHDLALEKNKASEESFNKTIDTVTSSMPSVEAEEKEVSPAPIQKEPAKSQAAPKIIKPAVPSEGSAAAEPLASISSSDGRKAEETKPMEAIAENKQAEKEEELARDKADDQAVSRSSYQRESLRKKDVSKPAAGADKRSAGLASSLASNTIYGKVTSWDDRTPMAGVHVSIKENSTRGVLTDAEGNYQLTITDTNSTLVFTFTGYGALEEKVVNRKEVNVQLEMTASQLIEVSVAGYHAGNRGEPGSLPITPAHPEHGNNTFTDYLEKNLQYPREAKNKKIEGRVAVEFTVEADGTLSNFKTLRGIGYGCEQELIRVIKEGPTWISTKRNGLEEACQVKVMFKFELPE